jgi:uncharacterized membrane protein YphA (DoxX/SURF4 family)
MTLVRLIAHPLLASTFVSAGASAVRKPQGLAERADPVTGPIARAVPYLPDDPVQLVRINGAVQVGAGLMLATGRLPRLSALVLAGSLVPTTLAGHPFWQVEDPMERRAARTQFLKNLGLLGGLLLAVVDTEGKPGLVWRASHAKKHAKKRVAQETKAAKQRTEATAKAAKRKAAAIA